MTGITCLKSVIFAFLLILSEGIVASPAKPGDSFSLKINVSGTIIASGSCNLEPENADIKLDFGNTVDKYLYAHSRTAGESFTIKLSDCDTSLGNRVRLTFQGTEDPQLPGLLSVNEKSLQGIAIGIETADGQALPVNQSTPAFPLTDGDNNISLKSYIQAEPAAIQNHSISLNSFSAVSNLVLDYE